MFEYKTVDEICRIAVAGGGFTLNAGAYPIDELARIAVAASSKGARVRFANVHHFSTDEICRLAVAGKGCIEFVEG